MIKMKKRRFVLLIVGVVIAALLFGFAGLNLFASAKDMVLVKRSDYETLNQIGDKYSKLYSLQKSIDEKSLWDTDEETQMNAIYKALLDSLGDKYSRYMNKEEYKAWSKYVNGTFTGIGLTFTTDKKGNFIITKVLTDSPAASGGLKEGDKLLKVDGKTYSDADAMMLDMRGEEGTKVAITYERGGRQKTVNLIRAEVAEQSVFANVIDKKYGYIQITGFEKTTAEQFKAELANLENKNVKGLIIDLRNNLGGFMDQGIEIADMLLPECTITHTEDKNGKKEFYNSDENCTKLKYVVLVNENTASASEIVAAAIKDNGGGKLVGTTTYGKGIIQSTVAFKDGTAMSLTIMQYLSPKNNKIHGIGVKPDYQVDQKKGAKKDYQLEKAIDLLS